MGFCSVLGKDVFSVLMDNAVSLMSVFLVDIWVEADKTMQQKQ